MSPLVVWVTYIMGVGTIALHIALVLFIIVTLCSPKWRQWLHGHMGRHGVAVSLGIVGASLIGSLFYSQVAGFAACLLCWIIRFLVYPQLITLGAYFHKPKRWLLLTSLVMSSAAAVVSAYQIFLQAGGAAIVNCQVIQSLGSCETEYFRIFGYVNIAVMSLTAALALVVCQAVSLHHNHRRQVL